MSELTIRFRRWRMRHWWPSRIKQLDRERADWKRWLTECEERLFPLIQAEEESKTRRTERVCIYPHREANELLESAWGLIANSYGGDWNQASAASRWKDAAERWRDRYHGLHDEWVEEDARCRKSFNDCDCSNCAVDVLNIEEDS